MANLINLNNFVVLIVCQLNVLFNLCHLCQVTVLSLLFHLRCRRVYLDAPLSVRTTEERRSVIRFDVVSRELKPIEDFVHSISVINKRDGGGRNVASSHIHYWWRRHLIRSVTDECLWWTCKSCFWILNYS